MNGTRHESRPGAGERRRTSGRGHERALLDGVMQHHPAGAAVLVRDALRRASAPNHRRNRPVAISTATILAVDVGTTGMKMGVYRATGDGLTLVRQFSRHYATNTYNNGLYSDIEQDKWRDAFLEGCRALGEFTGDVDVLSLSGTTPGFTAMDAGGEPVAPAILMIDQRSREQARRIIRTAGLPRLLETTANMPVAGGCSLASLSGLRENMPDAYRRIAWWGTRNVHGPLAHGETPPSTPRRRRSPRCIIRSGTTYMGRGNRGNVRHSARHPPPVIPSHESAGRLREDIAALTGLAKRPHTVIGGNDAVLAAYAVDVNEPGDIMNVNGTCEITLVCLPRCIPSTRYNIRAHVVPGRWLTLYVMNAGGKALEWFRCLFCRELDADTFYAEFLPAQSTNGSGARAECRMYRFSWDRDTPRTAQS